MTFAVARPLAEAVLLTIDRWYHSGDEEAPGSLWQAMPVPQTSGGIPSRASILAPPATRATDDAGDAEALVRLVRNFGFAGVHAAQLTPNLMRPVKSASPRRIPSDNAGHGATSRST